MVKRKQMLIILGLLLLAGLSMGWGIYLMKIGLVFQINAEEEIPFHFRLADNEVIGWNKGEMVWRLLVATIMEPPLAGKSPSRGGEDVILKDIYQGYFYRQGEVLFTFIVDEVHYNTVTGNLILYDFQMESPVGDWLKTAEISYDKKKELLHAPGKVTGRMAWTDLEADEMTIYLERERINLTNVKLIHTLIKEKIGEEIPIDP